MPFYYNVTHIAATSLLVAGLSSTTFSSAFAKSTSATRASSAKPLSAKVTKDSGTLSLQLASLLRSDTAILVGFDPIARSANLTDLPGISDFEAKINNIPMLGQRYACPFLADFLTELQNSAPKGVFVASLAAGLRSDISYTPNKTSPTPTHSKRLHKGNKNTTAHSSSTPFETGTKTYASSCSIVIDIASAPPKATNLLKKWKKSGKANSAFSAELSKNRYVFVSGPKKFATAELARFKKSRRQVLKPLGDILLLRKVAHGGKGDNSEPSFWITYRVPDSSNSSLGTSLGKGIKRLAFFTTPQAISAKKGTLIAKTVSKQSAIDLNSRIIGMLQNPLMAQFAAIAGLADFLRDVKLVRKDDMLYTNVNFSLIDEDRFQQMATQSLTAFGVTPNSGATTSTTQPHISAPPRNTASQQQRK